MNTNTFTCRTCSATFVSRPALESHLTQSKHRTSGRGRGGRRGRGRGRGRGSGGGRASVFSPSAGVLIPHGGRGGQGGRGRGGRTVIRRTHSVVTISSEKKTRKPFYCSLLVDKSGSMAGSKLEEAFNGVENLLKVLRPKDFVTFRAFNHNVDTAFVGVKAHKVNVKRMRANTKSGGCTALFDSVKAAAEDFKESNFKPLMILLTDGDDTSSTCSAADARNALLTAARKHKGFRAVLLSVGNDGLQQLKTMAKGIRGVDVHSVEQSATGVKKAFQWVSTHVTKIIRQEQQLVISHNGCIKNGNKVNRKLKFFD
mmetsp:Transcript_14709/g.23965  ORF Transcript_14709/g.23965 Transcript_14709/m.23965 type:complete len:313 (-) Transcript_14709:279-1217(-)